MLVGGICFSHVCQQAKRAPARYADDGSKVGSIRGSDGATVHIKRSERMFVRIVEKYSFGSVWNAYDRDGMQCTGGRRRTPFHRQFCPTRGGMTFDRDRVPK